MVGTAMTLRGASRKDLPLCRSSLCQYSQYQPCATILLISMVVMVFPVAIRAPVVGVPIHHARFGYHYRWFCHEDGCTLHNDRLWDYHRGRIHDHRWKVFQSC